MSPDTKSVTRCQRRQLERSSAARASSLPAVEAAEIARDSGVGHLLYYHIVPPLIIPGQESLFLNGAEKVFPDYTIGYDGVAFSLPANSADIIKISTGL